MLEVIAMNRLMRKQAVFRRRGFTLAETLVAVFVLSVVLAMSAALLTKSFHVSEQARDLTAAGFIARTVADRMLEAPFDALIGGGVARNGKSEQGNRTYNWSVEVEDVAGHEDLARLRVIVSWHARRGIGQQEFSCLRVK